MKYPIRILLVLALLLILTVQAEAAVEPFVKANWGSSPADVIHRAGVPAFNKVDFDAKKTEFLAYRQTIAAYNFTFYYLFNDEKLYQVRLELKEELWDTGFVDLGGTLNSMLDHALSMNADDGFSETTVEKRPAEGRPYASSRWWYTTETFALAVIDTDTPNGQVVFNVLLADTANPANAALIEDYREITAQIKAKNEALAQAPPETTGQNPGQFVVPTTAKRGFTAGLTTKMQALASGALNNWLRNAVVLMAVIILIVLTVIVFRKKRADRTEYRSTSNKAALRSRHKEAAASPAGRPAKAVATRAKAAMPKVRPATIRSVQKTLTAPLKKTSGGHVLNAAKHMPNNTMAAAPRPNPTTRGSFLAKKHPRPHK